MLETAVFDRATRPVRIGVYGAIHPTQKKFGFAHWDGERWGLWALTADDADRAKGWPSSYNVTGMSWFGLTRAACQYEATKIARLGQALACVC